MLNVRHKVACSDQRASTLFTTTEDFAFLIETALFRFVLQEEKTACIWRW
jgi:hypothetical protein